jgi:hypothetical protein
MGNRQGTTQEAGDSGPRVLMIEMLTCDMGIFTEKFKFRPGPGPPVVSTAGVHSIL